MPQVRRSITIASAIVVIIILLSLFYRYSPYDLLPYNTFSSSLLTGTSLTPTSNSSALSTKIETTLPGRKAVHGFTLLDRLYLRNGTFYIVTSNRSAFPPTREMTSPFLNMGTGHNTETDLTDKTNPPSQPHQSRMARPCGCHVLRELRPLSSIGTTVNPPFTQASHSEECQIPWAANL